ncbi:MAG: alginate export family protein [Candidatus Eisenbacteria bacterium]|nr:alginate export family protein [Candidatus Eisenbacteria bacterium]
MGLAGVLALTPWGALAGEPVVIDGQVRVRTEIDAREFDAGVARRHFTDLRARLGARAALAENGHAYIQIQDSRRLGGSSAGGAFTSGSLANGANLDAHQAYVQVDRLFSSAWGLRAGRFEVNLGNERLLGAVGWSNVGRAWEGVHSFYLLQGGRIDGLWLKAAERNSADRNRDFDAFAANLTLKGPGIQVLAVIENDAKDAAQAGQPTQLDRITAAGYLKRDLAPFDLEGNLAFQFGTQEFAGAGAEEADISAFLIALEGGYKLGGASRIALGIDLASGDDEPGDDEIKTFDNLYYTGHKFRGAMDYFVPSRAPGLLDAMLRYSTQPTEGWTLKGDVHYFATVADYVDFEGKKTTSVGSEMDITASTTRVKGVTVDLGASLFFASESFAGQKDPELGQWAWASMTANF